MLKVTGVNSAKVILDSKAEYLSASLSTPDILKPILGTGLECFGSTKPGFRIS